MAFRVEKKPASRRRYEESQLNFLIADAYRCGKYGLIKWR